MGDVPPIEASCGEIRDAELDAFVEQTMREFHAPGLAVMTFENGKVKSKGYGFSDLDNKVPVTPETLFFAGSTTKSFTSAIAAGLVESPEHPSIGWETPLADLVRDDFVLDQSSPEGQWATTHITIEDALSHRTGLPRHDLVWTNGETSNADIVRSLRHVPLHNHLRTKFEYCNNTFTAVALAATKTLKQPFKLLLEDHIFEPLHMNHTTYELEDALAIADKHDTINLARGYLWNEKTKDYELVPWDDIPPSTGAGGIISNVLDYQRWVEHLMKPTNLNHALGESAVKALRTPRTLVAPDPKRPFFTGPQAYGLGLYTQVYRGREILQHSGAIAGYMAWMMMVPPTSSEAKAGKSGWATVIMQNSYSAAQEIVAYRLLDRYLGTAKEEYVNMAQVARNMQAEKEEELKWDSIVKRLFGEDAKDSHISPALPIADYEGLYSHPAYHSFRLSLSDPKPHRNAKARQSHTAEAGVPLYLVPGSPKAYLDLSATLHHVSGEYWFSYQCYGPSHWLTDSAVKVQLVVGANGKVEGMRYQAEEAMDELAFFEKVDE